MKYSDITVDFQLEAKYEVEKEQEARLWMEAVIGESLDEVILAVPYC